MPHGGVVIDRVVSKNGVSIRLTDERWTHVAEEHGELAELISGIGDSFTARAYSDWR